MTEPKIDPEFQALCPPLTAEERDGLEKDIVERGCLQSLVVWVSGGEEILIDGHHRLAICKETGTGYKVTRLPFDSRDHVIEWIVSHQLSRRNLTEAQKAYLRGKQYEAEKRMRGRPATALKKTGQRARISENGVHTTAALAKEHGVDEGTLRRSGRFAKAVDRLAAAGGESARQNILTGAVGMNRTVVGSMQAVEELGEQTLQQVAAMVADGSAKSVEGAIEAVTETPPENSRSKSRHPDKLPARMRGKPKTCVSIVESLDEVGAAITAVRQRIEQTGGAFKTHRFNLDDQLKRLALARKLLSQVRSDVKGA